MLTEAVALSHARRRPPGRQLRNAAPWAASMRIDPDRAVGDSVLSDRTVNVALTPQKDENEYH